MASNEQGILRSGRYAEILNKDFIISAFDGYPGPDVSFTDYKKATIYANNGDAVAGVPIVDNVLNISGDFLMLDESANARNFQYKIIVGMEFPGSPSIGYITLAPGVLIRQPFLSVRVVAMNYETGGEVLRLIHGRGDFSINR